MPASKFVWYELMTTDPAAAEKFYDHVVGWTSSAAGAGVELNYTLLSAGDVQVAGLCSFPPELAGGNVPPHWGGYLAVDDVDAMALRVRDSGGTIMKAGTDIPGVGRFAVVADPQGATFLLFRGQGSAPPAPAPGMPGTVGWHELTTTDHAKAFSFYSNLFGWTKGEAIPMGEMGTYQLFEADGVPCGGMMNTPPGAPMHPAWGFYFNVAEINAAVARVKGSGGKVLHGPAQVPGGSWIVNALDPQGAVFSLVAPTKVD